MSDLFMDMHCRQRRWHNPLTSSSLSTITASTTSTTSSESPSSTQLVDDRTFSHHKYYSADASFNKNFNNSYRKQDEEECRNNNNDDSNEFANILNLKLRKPQRWGWELTTSKSCSSIALPRILLYDHKGKLLVDARNGNECVYREEDGNKRKSEKSRKRSHHLKQQQTLHEQRSIATTLTHSIQKALETNFNGLQIQEATPSPEPHSSISNHSQNNLKAIDFNTTDLPDYGLIQRSLSVKSVRFDVKDNDEGFVNYQSQIPEFLPTPPSTTTPTSSSSGPREKRKYRRSHSSGRSSALSESILERLSYQKGRLSSPEYAEEKEIPQRPLYFLRTSRAGTLIVPVDSFKMHPQRRRRHLKNRSNESLQSLQNCLMSRAQQRLESSSKSPTPNEMHRNGKKQHIPRYITKRYTRTGLNKELSTSEEDTSEAAVYENHLSDNVNSGLQNKCASPHSQANDLDHRGDGQQSGKVR